MDIDKKILIFNFQYISATTKVKIVTEQKLLIQLL